ncbi:MAG: hypothetical protein NW220_07760 [Leptolyngbyaceae cyanobacterium bins.349]|nr:hypothetical protein [Leptolyngbyaceae cyanobacterium bins.349]
MKRIIIATLSTLVLSTLVAPSAKAIRPELLGHPVHPTISEATAPIQASEMKIEQTEKAGLMRDEKAANKLQSQPSEQPPFEYFEKIYREKYGS